MARREDYWERVDADAASVLDHLRADADEWDILGVDLASQDDEARVLFLLVIRRKVTDEGNLLLSERYYKYDTVDREGTWLSNGIERRVNGSLTAALKVLYVALSNGDLDPDDPMLLDSRSNEGLDHDADDLTVSVRDLRDDGDDDDRADDLERQPEMKESREQSRTPDTVTCDNCGGEVAREDALNIGGGIGVDVWVHEGACEAGEADE